MDYVEALHVEIAKLISGPSPASLIPREAEAFRLLREADERLLRLREVLKDMHRTEIEVEDERDAHLG